MKFTKDDSRPQTLTAWLLCCALAGGVFLVYALASLAAGHGQYVLPLDDVYIHFQYAKQIAAGQPFVYNPGQPPTSGATSFLYPFALALGYALGFQGLNLSVWALAVGALALAGSAWLVYRLARARSVSYALALWGAALFVLTGAISWHFMSGMETGLVILFTLCTLYAFLRDDTRGLGLGGALLALTRPEGGILALIAAGLLALKAPKTPRWQERRWLLLPLLAFGVQPLVNLLLTGSLVATGNQAKSLFGMLPFYWDVVSARILENFARIWGEFATGLSPREGMYLPLGISLLAFVGGGNLLRAPGTRWTALLLLGWLLAGTAAVATLDPAFWHFKRYQMPLLALFFPLALWGARVFFLTEESVSPQKRRQTRLFLRAPAITGSVVLLLLALWTGANFLRYYALNVSYVYAQPLQMARWLQTNTPPDATVAVHDVGMMRYIGARTTIDMVGLTTAGAADAWRSGPGALAEFLLLTRPDYIAAYTSARGLSYLADTALYNNGRALIEFPVTVEMSANVALAAEAPEVTQGIFQPQWTLIDNMRLAYAARLLPALAVPVVNVADLASEARVNYRSFNSQRLPGFASEAYELPYTICPQNFCIAPLDGGRLINGEESFALHLPAGDWTNGAVLVSRLHPRDAATFDVYLNDRLLGTRWLPALPGQWLDVPTYIPAAALAVRPLRIRIVPHVPGGYYMPYQHWLYPAPPFEFVTGEPIVTYQAGGIALMAADIEVNRAQLTAHLIWQTPGTAQGDYMVFVHVYGDTQQPPLAQYDARPGAGVLPPGNWLPGALRETLRLDLNGLAAGQYQVAIGLYDAVTLHNLQPDTGGDALGRLFIAEIEVP
ncbi:MAG: hypothetical protein HXY40_07655 [Chloroflexi bacterium]|nr:hypothetical protein [Chloroflexota bacterium]